MKNIRPVNLDEKGGLVRMSSKVRSLSLARRGFLNYLFKKPFCVSFEITYHCSARCKHCHLGGPVKEERASARRFGLIARQLKPVVVQVSGGEPLLRQDIEEIIRAIRVPNSAPFIILTTNGALLTKKNISNSSRRESMNSLSLSIIRMSAMTSFVYQIENNIRRF